FRRVLFRSSIDPSDLGRQYEPIVRINSQSGKGGVAYVMESMYGFHLPKGLQVDFAKIIQDISEEEGEVSPERVYDTFIEEYVDNEEPYRFIKQKLIDISRSEEHTSELQSRFDLVCLLLLEKKKLLVQAESHQSV